MAELNMKTIKSIRDAKEEEVPLNWRDNGPG
jgi:hypothetical protein